MTAWTTVAPLACLLALCGAGPARAQTLPSEPIALAGGRVTIGADASATFGSDDPGFFNFSEYNNSVLRMVRVDVSAAVKMGPHLTFLTEVRTENLGGVRPYAIYLRIRPWTSRNVDIQVGRVPPTFGAFARRTYANDNPLVGYPLAYQYPTSLRPDAVPASADELLRKRSLGWLVKYSIGNPEAGSGVPLVTAFSWDTGVQVHGTAGMVRATGSLTAGTLSNPVFRDDNGGPQVAGRIELRPVTGVIAGVSVARGPFVARSATRDAIDTGHDDDFTQMAWGGDLEYSRAHYLMRFETIVSDWRLPVVSPPPLQTPLQTPLRALSTSAEARYKLLPGLYIAARYDHLGFSDIADASETLPWDAPVTRIEIGAGYSIQRNLLLKLSVQHNARDGGVLLRRANLLASQVVYWF